MTAPPRVTVVGQGYVGLPLEMSAVNAGHDVTGYEVSIDRVKEPSSGGSFVEDVPPAMVTAALLTGRYRVTDSPLGCDEFDVAVIMWPT